VARQLDLKEETFDVVQVGSTFRGGPLLCDTLYATVHAEAPHARFVDLTAPPVVGAVLLGMRTAGLHDPAVRQQLIDSAADCLNHDV
jgi:hypothetical protein